MKNTKHTTAIFILMLASTPLAQADVFALNNTGDYSVGGNWYNTTTQTTGKLPGAADQLVINNNRVATLTSVAPTLMDLTIGNHPTNTGTLIIKSGGSLVVDGRLRISSQTAGDGTLIQTGGSMTVNGENVNAFAVASSVVAATSGNGLYRISGGTLAVNSRENVNIGQSEFPAPGTGTFEIIGSDAVVNFNTLNVNATGVLKFQIGPTSVSTLHVMNTLTVDKSATLIIDGSAYNGNGASINLISARSFQGEFTLKNIIVTGFSQFSAVVSKNDGNIVLTIVKNSPQRR